MKSDNLVFVEARAEEVLFPAYIAYQNATHLYEKFHVRLASAPQQNTWPDGMTKGSEEHVLFLFLTTLVTLQSDSDEGFLQAQFLWEKYPECFTREAIDLAHTPPAHPQYRLALVDSKNVNAHRYPESELSRIFKLAGFNKPKPWARYWADTMQTLVDEYGGDPLAIIDDVKTVDGFLARKKQEIKNGKPWWFNGMGPKLFSLFCIFCEELSLIKPVVDAFPADVHVQRIALGTGMVASLRPRISDTRIAELLRINLSAFCMKHWGSAVDLSHILWLGGSKMCKNCHRTADIEKSCAMAPWCAGSPNTMAYWRKGRWQLDVPWNPKGSRTEGLVLRV